MTYVIDEFKSSYRIQDEVLDEILIDWNYFYERWKNKVFTLRRLSKDTEFASIIDEWCSVLLSYDWHEEKQAVENKIAFLNLDSLIRLKRIIARYDEQFSLLAQDAADYADFDNLIGFLEDLPGRLLESIEFLEHAQNSIAPDWEQKNTQISFPETGDYQQCIEDVDIPQHLFLFIAEVI